MAIILTELGRRILRFTDVLTAASMAIVIPVFVGVGMWFMTRRVIGFKEIVALNYSLLVAVSTAAWLGIQVYNSFEGESL